MNFPVPIHGRAKVIALEQSTGGIYLDNIGWAFQPKRSINPTILPMPVIGSMVKYYYFDYYVPKELRYTCDSWDEQKINHEIDWRKEGF